MDTLTVLCILYEGSLEKTAEAVVERVPRKDIRPCPPPMETMEGWAVGDVAEVFDVGSWIMAMILKVLDGDYHLVRLLGSSEKLKVHKSNIRVRQIWQDDKWVVIRKGSWNCEFVKFNKPSSLNSNICLQESHIVSSRTLKRASPYCSSLTEAYSGKMRAIENEGESQRVISEFPSPLLKKGRNSEPIHCDSDASSVGSCSVFTNSPNRLSGDLLTCSAPDCDTLSSDADSCYDCRDEEGKCFLSLKDSVATSIHRLELHDYWGTLEAIYASGPLSWEQEAQLTNLRVSLNISNDEHLLEIRNLKSAGYGLHLS